MAGRTPYIVYGEAQECFLRVHSRTQDLSELMHWILKTTSRNIARAQCNEIENQELLRSSQMGYLVHASKQKRNLSSVPFQSTHLAQYGIPFVSN